MADITTAITQLDTKRKELAANISAKGVLADESETLSELIPKVLDISGGDSGEWQPLSDWWDIEQIVQDDVQGTYQYKVIELLSDSDITSEFTGGTAYKTSDGQFYSTATASHRWDETKDLPCSEGYKTRWVIKYYNAENISLTIQPSCLYFVIDKAKFNNSGLAGKSCFMSFKLINGADLQANVTSLADVFNGCVSLCAVPLFNTSNVTAMNGMFYNCGSLHSVPLFDTSKATNMSGMFSWSILASLPMLDTSKVTNMLNMFRGGNLTSLPMLDTSSVTNMSGMFSSCPIRSIPMFDTSKVANMSAMFEGSTVLLSAKLRNINTSVAFVSPHLTRDSMMYLIRNRSGTGTITITLGAVLLAKLSEADKAEATARNITLA